ncbi:unnamed protein product [Arabis nemorensis]|uniref:Uncharacterized protein n=1 Tax=Arabis nemorensis TaxID=586526 RepID=A0A565C9J7_9BRAS|nr:unnamed protein product [Arabis nemorensis]
MRERKKCRVKKSIPEVVATEQSLAAEQSSALEQWETAVEMSPEKVRWSPVDWDEPAK